MEIYTFGVFEKKVFHTESDNCTKFGAIVLFFLQVCNINASIDTNLEVKYNSLF